MADIRPKDLLPTATIPADDDYLLLDGATQGTRKQLASQLVEVHRFGAVGDWNGSKGTDNAAAFDVAMAVGGTVYIPPGDYLFSRAIVVPEGVRLVGASEELVTLRRAPTDVTTETITDNASSFTSRNTLVFFRSGGYRGGSALEGVTLRGNSDPANGTTLIELGADVTRLTIRNVYGILGRIALLTSGTSWMIDINQFRANSCAQGINGKSTTEKTSWDMRNVFVENCGTGFDFLQLTYSILTACGADHIARPMVNPYDAEDTNPYGVAFGDPARAEGVYNFTTCRGVTLNGCGSEYCWSNGYVRNANSDVVANGFRGFGLKSAYEPDYTKYPNEGVGPFVFATDPGSFVINAPSISGFTQYEATSTKIYFVAINYMVAWYGSKDYRLVTLAGADSSAFANGTFGGQIGSGWQDYGIDLSKLTN